jgi:ABC-type Fe3+/spermidine/putrescine transport system ATPase subunit
MAEPILELCNVGKHFAGIWAVSDVSFAVRKGQTIALLGPSGCGKTTTLRMIAGFLEPDLGAIRIGGRDMARVPPYERNIGLVFQDYALFPHLTVEQNIAYGLRQRRLGQNEIAARVRAMIELVQLGGYEAYRPAALSGGQQQRVALARSIAIAPELMLLDEPLSALDAKLRQELRFELKHILLAANCTALIVTHDREEAMSLADHVIVMHYGRILQEGAPATIYAAPQSRAVAEFIGRANWFDGRLGALVDGYREFLSPDGPLLIADRPELVGRSCHLCVRPERLVILETGEPNGRLNVVDGSLETVAHLGAEIHYVVRLPSGRMLLVFEQNRDQPIPDIGKPLRLGFRPNDGVLIAKDTAVTN